MLRKIGKIHVKPLKTTLTLEDISFNHPYGVMNDVVVKVDKPFFPSNFVTSKIQRKIHWKKDFITRREDSYSKIYERKHVDNFFHMPN